MRVLTTHSLRRLFGAHRLGTIVVLAICSCSREPEAGAVQDMDGLYAAGRSLPGCFAPYLDTSKWIEVPARDAEFTVRLPRLEGEVSGTAHQIWRSGSGSVSYSVQPLWRGWVDSVSELRTRGYCMDTIAQRPVAIYHSIEHSPFGPGDGLQAFWQLGKDRELELILSWQTKTARDTLFAIARSVRLH